MNERYSQVILKGTSQLLLFVIHRAQEKRTQERQRNSDTYIKECIKDRYMRDTILRV